MKRLLLIVWLFTLQTPAFAGNLYAALSIGSSTEADLSGSGQVASGTSYSALFGFHIDQNFSYEVGYTSLFHDAGISNTATRKTIKGLEIAGVASYPVEGRLSAYARAGYANLDPSYSTGVLVSNLQGFVYGVGLQYGIDESIAVRAGYKILNLTGQTGDAIVRNTAIEMLYDF